MENNFDNRPEGENDLSGSQYRWQQDTEPAYRAPDYGYSSGNEGGSSPAPNGDHKKPHKTGKKIAMIAGCVVVLGVAAAVGVKGVDMLLSDKANDVTVQEEQQNVQEKDAEDQQEQKQDAQTNTNAAAEIQNSTISLSSGATVVSDIAENAMPSMVSIDCTITENYSYFGQNYSQDSTGSGSGFIIEESDTELFIATNNHVVEGANSIEVTFIDGEKAEATTKGTDTTADLAVISVKKNSLKKSTKQQIRIAALGDSNDVRLGEMVVAIGNALGYGQSVTVGYVSAKDREVAVSSDEKMVLLQTDAAINPGNSGGALINLQGQVIGIPTVKYADSTVEGMGFAIPISRATPILDELVKREVLTEEEQGYLGVSCLDVTSEANELYGIPVGVYVSEVSDDGAAKEAGIQVGDIITALNGVETSSKEALVEKVHSYRIGTEITLTIQRSNNGKYKEMEVKATLKEKSTIDGLSGSDSNTQTGQGSGSSSGNSGGSNRKNESSSNGSTDNSGGNYGNSGDTYDGYYGRGDAEDFYDFFSDFFR